jgi:hypothetical protein
MSKIRKLMIVCVMALMMMVVALPSALAQDWCYWGCNPAYWTAPAATDTATEPDCHWERGWVWDEDFGWERVWVWVCDD